MSVCRTLASIGIPRSTFCDWYSRYQDGGIEALEDGRPRPRRVWNKFPDEVCAAIVNLALKEPDLSPRDLAVNFADTQGQLRVRGQHLSALEGSWPGVGIRSPAHLIVHRIVRTGTRIGTKIRERVNGRVQFLHMSTTKLLKR